MSVLRTEGVEGALTSKYFKSGLAQLYETALETALRIFTRCKNKIRKPGVHSLNKSRTTTSRGKYTYCKRFTGYSI